MSCPRTIQSVDPRTPRRRHLFYMRRKQAPHRSGVTGQEARPVCCISWPPAACAPLPLPPPGDTTQQSGAPQASLLLVQPHHCSGSTCHLGRLPPVLATLIPYQVSLGPEAQLGRGLFYPTQAPAHFTDTENSPGELSLSRIRKAPSWFRFIRISSASCREILPEYHLQGEGL